MRERESHGRLNISNIVIKLFMQKAKRPCQQIKKREVNGRKVFGQRGKMLQRRGHLQYRKNGLFCNV